MNSHRPHPMFERGGIWVSRPGWILFSGIVSYATIDNTTYSYLIYAYSASWDSNLRIKAAVIVYTVSTVP